MASYIEITDAEVDPEAPITSFIGYRWRDNPIAIAERATGAPRVKPSTMERLTGSGNWTVPAGVTRVKVRLVGGGGGSVDPTGGGGGGGYVEGVLDVTPAALIAYVVGAGGAAGNNGIDTTFNGPTSFKGDGGLAVGTGGTGSGSGVTFVIDGQHGEGGATAKGGSSHWSPGNLLSNGRLYGGGAGTGGVSRPGAGGTIILEY